MKVEVVKVSAEMWLGHEVQLEGVKSDGGVRL